MFKRITAVSCVAAGLLAAGGVLPAVAADTSATTSSATGKPALDGAYAPGVTIGSSHSATASFAFQLDNLPKGSDPWLAVWTPDVDAQNPYKFVPLDQSKSDPTVWGTDVSVASTVPTGHWGAEVVVYASTAKDAKVVLDDGATFPVRRATHQTLNASPEPAAHGETLTVAGTLTHYSPTAKKNTAYAGKSLDIYFNPTGSAPRKKVATVTTNSHGEYAKHMTATTTGTWSAQFAGTSNYAASTSNGDHVIVETKKTHLTVNASPEPVKKGGAIAAAGRLTHATSVRGTLHYTSYKDKTLTVWFNPTGPKGAIKMGTVMTDASGYYAKKFTQSVEGSWYVTFAGTSNYSAVTSNHDHVVVK